MKWRKASHSNGEGSSCVEVARAGQQVATRDSKDQHGPYLRFDRQAFGRLLAEVKTGRYDL